MRHSQWINNPNDSQQNVTSENDARAFLIVQTNCQFTFARIKSSFALFVTDTVSQNFSNEHTNANNPCQDRVIRKIVLGFRFSWHVRTECKNNVILNKSRKSIPAGVAGLCIHPFNRSDWLPRPTRRQEWLVPLTLFANININVEYIVANWTAKVGESSINNCRREGFMY